MSRYTFLTTLYLRELLSFKFRCNETLLNYSVCLVALRRKVVQCTTSILMSATTRTFQALTDRQQFDINGGGHRGDGMIFYKIAKTWVIPLNFRRFEWRFQWQNQRIHSNFRQIWWHFLQLNSRQIWWQFLHRNSRRFFTQIFAKICENSVEKSIENQFCLHPQKILPSKVFELFRI